MPNNKILIKIAKMMVSQLTAKIESGEVVDQEELDRLIISVDTIEKIIMWETLQSNEPSTDFETYVESLITEKYKGKL